MVALWEAIRTDLLAFRERIAVTPPPQPGLYTYRFNPPGGSVRVHLRIEQDRSAVLFVDVTDVIHLNATAAEIAKWALDGVPQQYARARLRGRFGRRGSERDVAAVYGMIERFARPGNGCPTCSLAEVERTPWFSTAVNAPYKADLAITYDCNNDCPHCYNEPDRLAMAPLSPDQWKVVIDTLAEVGVPHLIFTGGEATLYPFLPDLIRHADARGPICGLNTNGRRMAHRQYADELAASGLNHVQVTLGSHREEVHDRMMHARSFRQTVRGIENALKAGLHTITNTTLMRMNADEIEDTIAFLHQLGIRTFAVNGMIYSGGGFDTGEAIAEQLMPPLLVRIRDRAEELGMRFLWYTPTQYCRLSPVELDIGAKRCNAGEYSLCVEPNADILPCQSYYAAAGNLLRDPWERIWNSELFVSFRDRERDPQRYGLPEMCWECPDLPLCGGGCRIEREAAEGNRISGETHCAGGCKTGACAVGGCGTGGGSISDGRGTHTEHNTDFGFVSLDQLQSSTRRRGTGVFA